jgi:hypothetical protein
MGAFLMVIGLMAAGVFIHKFINEPLWNRNILSADEEQPLNSNRKIGRAGFYRTKKELNTASTAVDWDHQAAPGVNDNPYYF